VIAAAHTSPDLDELVGPFYGVPDQLAEFRELTAEEIPPPYRSLLVHDQHMTVTLESFHGCPVQLQLLHRSVNDTHYARNTLLRRASDGKVVQFGIARLCFSFLPDRVREEIEAAQTPMGRVLISHNVLRRVQLTGLWRLLPRDRLAQVFGLQNSQPTYGRTALIFCSGEPAVEVLEVMPPGLDGRGVSGEYVTQPF
jgi:chorismate-pyruvate lyase